MGTEKSRSALEKFGMRSSPDWAGPAKDTFEMSVVSWVPIRTLKAKHRRQILDHLLQLDELDRYLRFGFHASLEHLSRYVAGIDFRRDEVFGVFSSQLDLLAVAHLAGLPALIRDTGVPGEKAFGMEFGVSVLSQARGRGLGQRMFEHAIMHARNHGAQALIIRALEENQPMMKIAIRAGAQLESDGVTAEGWLRLPKDTLATHMESSLLAWAAEVVFGLRQRQWRVKRWFASG